MKMFVDLWSNKSTTSVWPACVPIGHLFSEFLCRLIFKRFKNIVNIFLGCGKNAFIGG